MISFGGEWFGPPVLVFCGRVVDGRIRSAAARGIVAKPPTQYALHANHVVRWLVAAGHVERALGYVTSTGAGGLDRVDLARFGLPHEQEAQMLAAFRGVVRRVQKRQPRRALQVVGRLRDLRLRAIEDGDPITVADLSEALGDWR